MKIALSYLKAMRML